AAGADAVKFQTVFADESYQPGTESHRVFSATALSPEAMRRLNARARARGLVPFSTPGGFRALAAMLESGMAMIKISSGLLTNWPLIERAAASGLPLVLSTGMADADEVEAALLRARAAGAQALAVLHCTSLYPAPAETLNLRAIVTLARTTGLPVGYSDHFRGPLAAVAAVALGACVIEKHLTLDSSLAGADHAISAEPEAFADMVRQIRAVEAMLGDGIKRAAPAEVALRSGRRRFVVARRAIPAGARLVADDLALLRCAPGAGRLPANAYHQVLGARARVPIASGEPLDAAMIEGGP
ncbi:MAG TPA: N-acetylneuraminate synthase family protein, partial [Alphaproteobacteria bacterium]